ncbi:MAG: cell wall hydrolase [Lachnospiraceae bacterium]|nr:cell wall hydrolase [Lachnospiraceae bacterium]
MAGVLCLSLLMSLHVFADTQDKIDATNQKIDDLTQQKEDAEQQIEDLNQQKNEMEGKLSGLNQKLSDVSSSLEEVQNNITEKKKEIEDTKAALVKAEEKSASQYESMKLRIQFMYENGDQSFTTLLFESKSISDLLNKTDYVKEISAYDREMLIQYQKTQEDIANKEAQLETEEAELIALETDMKNKQSEVKRLISDTQNTISQYTANISNQQSVAADLETKINEQKEYEKQLEIQKAKEDAARLAEIKRQEEEAAAALAAGTAVPLPSGEGDLSLLAALIYCEAGGESYEGQLAVGSVVINRVRSAYYPNSISGVIYQSGQFSPVASGRLATVLGSGLTSASCMQAAQEVLNGNITNQFLYFRTNNGVIQGTVIGNHVFY